MGLLAVVLYPFPTTTVFSSIAFQLELQRLREYPSDLPKLLDGHPNVLNRYGTNFDEVADV